MAAGESSAINCPAAMKPSRWQNSASSRKCVVMSTVTPRAARSWIKSQNIRREIGSTPLVGSSRNRIGGSCRMAQPSASRCWSAPESVPVSRPSSPAKPARPMTAAVRSRNRAPSKPYTPPKKAMFSATVRSR